MKATTFWSELEQRRPEARMALGLERIERALRRLGEPQRRVPTILVAGTNGKGTTSAFLEALLADAGWRVGCFVSPHLFHPCERIRLGQRPLPEAELVPLLAWLTRRHPELTYFELFAVAAFRCFAEAGVQAAVMEVGLGGRLDATNVARRRLATVITTVGYDHTRILGRSLPAIAREKAGIIRPSVPLVMGRLPAPALRVVREIATMRGAQVLRAGRPPYGTTGLPEYLAANAAVAQRVAGQIGLRPDPRGPWLATRPFGRFTFVATLPDKIVDGAHNGEGARALATALRRRHPRWQIWLRLARSKDPVPVITALAPVAAGWVLLVDDGDPAPWWSPAALARHLPPGTPWRMEPVTTAVERFLAVPEPAVWTGTLRGLMPWRAWVAGGSIDAGARGAASEQVRGGGVGAPRHPGR